MSFDSDTTLRAAAGGDHEAWRDIVDAYSPRVYGLIFRQCADPELAEEITQQTFVKVVEKLGGYKEQGRFDAWIFRIAINRLRDEMRRRKRQAIVIDMNDDTVVVKEGGGGVDGPGDRMIKMEANIELREAIAGLPEADREVLHLRYVADLGFSQIAKVLMEPLGTVLARNHRALKKLKERLSGEGVATSNIEITRERQK